jgi:glyoxylase-like metal-dependent hydrolase (beta-lactamase superfamily II)
VSHGEVVRVGPLEVRALLTPGHTPGSQCLSCGDAVLTGDTVFVNACGRCDLRGGDPAAMFRSITQVLMKLPDSTQLFPGHHYGDVPISSIGREKRHNPYFQQPSLEAFLAYRGG